MLDAKDETDELVVVRLSIRLVRGVSRSDSSESEGVERGEMLSKLVDTRS